MLKRFFTIVMLGIAAFNSLLSEELTFSCKSDFYTWIEKQESRELIESLSIQDGWNGKTSDFVSHEHYSDEDFVAISEYFPNLTSLHLSMNEKLTDVSLLYLQNFKNLSELTLINIKHMTDGGLVALPLVAPQLKVLKVGGNCPHIQGTTLLDFVKGLPFLSELVVNVWIPTTPIDELEQRLINVKQERPDLRVFYGEQEIK